MEEMAEKELILYESSESQDVLLIRWWMSLHDSGELEKAFSPAVQTPSAFLNLFQPSNILIYARDEDIWLAAWFENMFGDTATFMGLWVDEQKRGTKEAVKLTRAIYNYALRVWPTIFSVTKQESLLSIMQQTGYTLLGEFPKFWGGVESACLLSLTSEGFQQGILGGDDESLQQSSNQH